MKNQIIGTEIAILLFAISTINRKRTNGESISEKNKLLKIKPYPLVILVLNMVNSIINVTKLKSLLKDMLNKDFNSANKTKIEKIENIKIDVL